MGIKKIEIRTATGFVGTEHAYNDRLVLTKDAVSYEFNPLLASERRPNLKWTYTPPKKMYTAMFADIGEMAERYCSTKFNYFVMDAGSVTISITYENGLERSEDFCCYPEEFEDLFMVINRLETPYATLLGMKI